MPNPVDTRALIAALVDDLTPVRPAPAPWLRFVRSLAVVALLTGAGAALLGLRFDWRQPLDLARFGSHVGLELVTGVLAALAAFLLSAPGPPRAPAVRWLPVGAGIVWLLLLTGQLAGAGESTAIGGGTPAGACFSAVMAIAALPAAMLLIVILRAAPLEPAWSAGFAAAGAASVAAFATHFHCLNVGPAHGLVSHVAPVFGFAAMGAIAGVVWPRAASMRFKRRILGKAADPGQP